MNRLSIITVYVVLSLIGFALLPRLPLQLIPSKAGKSLQVQYSWLGASPEVMERQVTTKLEGAFSILSGVKKISSISSYNQGYISLELDPGTDIDDTRFELAQLIRQVSTKLPLDMSYPQIVFGKSLEKQHTAALMSLQLSGPVSSGVLQQYASEQLKPKIAAVSEVGSVNVYGGNQNEWVLSYNTDALMSLKITEADLRLAVQRYFKREALGQLLELGGQTLRVTLNNELSAVRWDFPISKQQGRIIRLNDLVKVRKQSAPPYQFYRINGKTAINILINTVPGSNQLTVATNLRQRVAQLSLPADYQIDISYDNTIYIRNNIKKTGLQIGGGIGLLLIFLAFITRSIKYIILIMSGIAASLLLSVIVFYLLQIEMHLFSFAALTISLGIMVNSMIIVVDHYRRYYNTTIFTALLGATLTTCFALTVLWILPDENRQILDDFAFVIVVTLFMSLLVSLGFVPSIMKQPWFQASKTYKIERRTLRQCLNWERVYVKLIIYLLRLKRFIVIWVILLFGLPVFLIPNRLSYKNSFSSYYNLITNSSTYVGTIQPIISKLLGGTLGLFVNYVYEGSYEPQAERTALYIVAELPNQSTPEQMDAIFRRFETDLDKYSEIEQRIVQINSGQTGSMVIYFKHPYDLGSFPYQLKNRIISLSTEMSGIEWNIFGVGQGFNKNAGENQTQSFNVELFGYNYQQLDQQVQEFAKMLDKDSHVQAVNKNRNPGLFQHKSLYEYILETNSQKIAVYGIDIKVLYEYLVDFNSHQQPDFYAFINGEYEAIKIVPVDIGDLTNWTLQRQPILLGDRVLKLIEIGRVTRQSVTPEIYRENQQYRRLISFDYIGTHGLGERFLKKTLNELRPHLPLGYTVRPVDQFELSNVKGTHYDLLLVMALIIYIISAILFENLWQPFILICQIPLSYIGVFLAFYCTDSNFDQGGYMGFLLLGGNVVSVNIFIINEVNQLSKRYPYLSAVETYTKALRRKFPAILVAIVSTMLSIFPFLFYKNEPIRYALSLSITSGLAMSILVTLLFMPILMLPKPIMFDKAYNLD